MAALEAFRAAFESGLLAVLSGNSRSRDSHACKFALTYCGRICSRETGPPLFASRPAEVRIGLPRATRTALSALQRIARFKASRFDREGTCRIGHLQATIFRSSELSWLVQAKPAPGSAPALPCLGKPTARASLDLVVCVCGQQFRVYGAVAVSSRGQERGSL